MEERFFVESVKCGVSWVGPGVGVVNAEIEYVKNDERKYLSLSECDGFPGFYLTNESIYEKMMNVDEDVADYMASVAINDFEGIKLGEYEKLEASLEDNSDNPASNLIEYIVAVVRCSEEDLEEYIQLGTGKYVDEIVIPGEETTDFRDLDQESLYKERLYIEACIEQPHVFDVIDGDSMKSIKKDLKAVKKLTDEGYIEWKEKILSEKLNEIKDEKLITVPFMFAGVGSFLHVMPESELESFMCFIDNNGSAFMSEPREASEEERKFYIAKNIVR